MASGLKRPGRRFILTIHDTTWFQEWTDEFFKNSARNDRVKFFICNTEIAPTTLKWHGQAFIVLKDITMRPDAVLEMLKLDGKQGYARAWIGHANGSGDSCEHYCMKPVKDCLCPHCEEAENAWQAMTKKWTDEYKKDLVRPTPTYKKYGSLLSEQGRRNDVITAATDIKNLGLLAAVEKSPAVYVKYSRGMEALDRLIGPKEAVPDPGIELRPWQTYIWSAIQCGHQPRQILWVWSKESGTGKTTMGKYLSYKMGAGYLPGTFKIADLMHMLNTRIHKLVHFDLPRDSEMNETQFSVLEQLSDCRAIPATKYDSQVKYPRLIVLVTWNGPPPRHRLPKRIYEWCLDVPESVAGAYNCEPDMPPLPQFTPPPATEVKTAPVVPPPAEVAPQTIEDRIRDLQSTLSTAAKELAQLQIQQRVAAVKSSKDTFMP